MLRLVAYLLRLGSVPRLRVACLVVCRVLRDHTVSYSVLPGVLPLLTPRDRVVWSCVPGVRWSHGLVVIILSYNTKH